MSLSEIQHFKKTWIRNSSFLEKLKVHGISVEMLWSTAKSHSVYFMINLMTLSGNFRRSFWTSCWYHRIYAVWRRRHKISNDSMIQNSKSQKKSECIQPNWLIDKQCDFQWYRYWRGNIHCFQCCCPNHRFHSRVILQIGNNPIPSSICCALDNHHCSQLPWSIWSGPDRA